ncbi:hypothetical protein AAVH_23943 [Aphelenchoides avenae]|nr:hypothetical protein AAVH_23943 [Aphelenchus avenae]
MTQSMFVCIAIDVFVSIGDLGLVIANIKQRAKIGPEYSLRLSYQLKENNITTKIIFPCSVVHSVAYGIYLLLNSVVYSLAFGNFSPNAAVMMESTQMVSLEI